MAARRTVRAGLSALVGLASLGLGASAGAGAAAEDGPLCVIAVQPPMKLVTLVSPDKESESGALALFFPELPAVQVGDLVRVTRGPDQSPPTLEKLETGAASCKALAKRAADAHADH